MKIQHKRGKINKTMNPVRDNTIYYVYIIQSVKNSNWYTGFTYNLRKRFKEHNSNEVYSTKNRGPFELIYYEMCKMPGLEKNILKPGWESAILKID